MNLAHNTDLFFFFKLHKIFYTIFISSSVLFIVILFVCVCVFNEKCHTQHFLRPFMMVCGVLFPFLAGDKYPGTTFFPPNIANIAPPHSVRRWWCSR